MKVTNRRMQQLLHRPIDKAAWWYLWFVVGCAALAAPAIYRLSGPAAQSDIYQHATIAQELVAEGRWFVYSVYYPINWLVRAGSGDPTTLKVASAALLLGCVALKAWITLFYARKFIKLPYASFAAALVVMFAMPLVDPSQPDDIYLGQLSPNVWHNSTAIMASVLVLPTFYAATMLIARPTVRGAWACAFWLSAVTLAKPSYATALLPVVILWLILRLAKNRAPITFALAVLAAGCALPAAIVAFQTWATYAHPSAAFPHYVLVIDPFRVWSAFSGNIPFSVLVSIAAPMIALVAAPRAVRMSTDMRLAWFALLAGVAQFVLVSEQTPQGQVALMGNFTWAVVPTMSVLCFVSLKALVRSALSAGLAPDRRWLLAASAVLFLGHLWSGIYYVLHVGTLGFPTYV